MKIKAYVRFERCYQDLPKSIQKKVDMQIKILANDFRHPSLHTKKIKGSEGIWEVRVDIFYRLTFEIIEDTIFLRVVGNHDEVLKSP
ncbi:MAG: hypothetical protein HY096_04040 [Nitrospinae bacterium]|nr:hypothetical protein [Nitrospinota bacterium]